MEPEIDRNDPRYKKLKKKISQYLLMANMYASSTTDTDDDEIASMATEFFTMNFDRMWALRHPKKPLHTL